MKILDTAVPAARNQKTRFADQRQTGNGIVMSGNVTHCATEIEVVCRSVDSVINPAKSNIKIIYT